MTQMVQRMQAAGLAESEAHVQDGMRVRASAGAASFHRKATLSKSLEKAQTQVQVLEQARAAETSDLSAREQAAQERLPSSQTGDKRSRMEEATMGRASAGQSEVAFSSG